MLPFISAVQGTLETGQKGKGFKRPGTTNQKAEEKNGSKKTIAKYVRT